MRSIICISTRILFADTGGAGQLRVIALSRIGIHNSARAAKIKQRGDKSRGQPGKRCIGLVMFAVDSYANGQLKHKMLFGSDFPLISPDRWLTDFEQAGFKPEVRDLIVKHNAVRALGLATD